MKKFFFLIFLTGVYIIAQDTENSKTSKKENVSTEKTGSSFNENEKTSTIKPDTPQAKGQEKIQAKDSNNSDKQEKMLDSKNNNESFKIDTPLVIEQQKACASKNKKECENNSAFCNWNSKLSLCVEAETSSPVKMKSKYIREETINDKNRAAVKANKD